MNLNDEFLGSFLGVVFFFLLYFSCNVFNFPLIFLVDDVLNKIDKLRMKMPKKAAVAIEILINNLKL